MLGKLDMWQRNTWVVTTQISTKHNITEFYVAFTNRLIVIVIIAIITELTFVGFSNFSFSRDERNVEFINSQEHFGVTPQPPPPWSHPCQHAIS